MKSLNKTNQKNISRVRSAPAVAGFCLIIACVFQTGCKKLLEVDPPIDKSASTTVFSNTTYAVQAMTGVYADFIQRFENGYYLTDHSLRLAYTADELTAVGNVNNGPAGSVYRDQYNTDPGGDQAGWKAWYTFIYRANAIIDGVNASTGISKQSKTILNSEAKFMRAFCYFYLVNLYGDCPLITTSLYTQNINVPRVSKDLIYAQMVQDLKDAQSGLTDNYLSVDLTTATTEKVRPNKMAATALLARVYLYMGKWSEAETEATTVINNSNYSLLTDLNSVFLKNSGEAIWQLQPNPQGSGRYFTANTLLAAYLLPDPYATPQWEASDELLAAMEPGDLRQQDWLEYADNGSGTLYPVPFKYKLGKYQMDPEEYIMVLRLAEQYLIRAEARAQQHNLTGSNSAESDVNAIRSRAGLAGTTAGNDQAAMLADIAKQRFAEMFMEWGDRWLDLKRTNKIDAVMSVECPLKIGSPVWDPHKALFAIPFSEFIYNPALHGHQNPGYPETQ